MLANPDENRSELMGNKTIATATIRVIVTVDMVVYKYNTCSLPNAYENAPIILSCVSRDRGIAYVLSVNPICVRLFQYLSVCRVPDLCPSV